MWLFYFFLVSNALTIIICSLNAWGLLQNNQPNWATLNLLGAVLGVGGVTACLNIILP